MFTLRVRATWPDAYLVGPNMSNDLGNAWLVEFFRLLPDDVLDAYSMHIYATSADTVKGRVDLFCRRIEQAGKACDRPVWITEMGYRLHMPQARETMRRWALEARADSRVEMVFGFTNWNDCCPEWNLLTRPEAALTATGRGWVEAATVPLEAYP